MSRNVVFAPDEFYHLYNRGTEKRNVFGTKADYERFLALLYLSNGTSAIHIDNLRQQIKRGRTLLEIMKEFDREKSLVDIGAYCLMPNHFHLLVQEKSEGGISKFMQKLLTAYTMYFNTSRVRTGALFQGKFKATHATDDKYLAYLISYIHLNPVKLIEPKWKETGIAHRTRALSYLEKYQYSSFPDYIGQVRPQQAIINKSALPPYCESLLDFKKAVREWLDYHKDDL
ncbi:MAG: hypothetical protein A3A33_03570 [Candidatus Yanofskybacteria bacterium RIFCSPLOWO2_01_FULL_49_25]|uniref:Transposase IS200-like domain-containing protein n=1 Tax=Candidatus Yanofskybacteria bacterium RIFCSPLOWO2_01_FULL_49_25 TaxID=1802701 RepID=A0A1F8GVQ8_9BACT|nr:MAG: hypothetical protein A3A33_03570 [Candidatus Yanofskybacteria bacterium RIFCSPLOWO2_01_FULL_49_25]